MTTTNQTDPRPVLDSVDVGYLIRDHKIVADSLAQLHNIVDNHRRHNTLIGLGNPRRQTDGTYLMPIRIYEPRLVPVAPVTGRPASREPRRRLTRTPAVITAIAGVAMGLLTSLAYLIGLLAEFTATYAAAILVILALAAIVTGALCRPGRRRRHCPGC